MRMGLYGKYTKTVNALAITQMVAGVLMLFLGIALRVFVCSWVTNAAFGFWIGLWVFTGGLIGHKSAKKNIYGMIGYFLGFNSLSIMLASVVIFCHSLALVHSHMEMQPYGINIWNQSNHSRNITPSFTHSIIRNISNSTSVVTFASTYTISSTSIFSQTINANTTKNLTSITNITSTVASKPSGTSNNNTTPSTTRGCYTHQTWSDYENGKRGVGLGAGMIFVCFVEILVAVLSFGYCWSAANIEPTDVVKHKVVVQGIYSDIVSSLNVQEVVPNLRGNEEERPPETEIITTLNDDEEEEEEEEEGVDHQYEDIPAASNTKERAMNVYDFPGASEEESGQYPEQSSVEQSSAGERDGSETHTYDSVIADIKLLMQQKGETVCDAFEMKPMGSYGNAPGTSTNDEVPCSSSYYSLPPFNPPCYPSLSTHCPDSD